MSQASVVSDTLPGIVEEIHEPALEQEQSAALALSVDEFAALEERVLRAVNLVKRERVARVAAEDHAKEVEARLAERSEKLNQSEEQMLEQMTQVEQLQGELKTLRSERDHVRQRVERLLSQLDELEL